MEPLAVDIATAARMTSLSVHTLRLYVKKKILRATKCGRRVVIPVASLEKLVHEGAPKRNAVEEAP